MRVSVIHNNSINISKPNSPELGFGLSVASADKIGDIWHISRVNVHRAVRGQGLGSKMLQRIIHEVKLHEVKCNIIVHPGGYNEDPERQFAFYKKNGFVERERGEYIYII